MYIKQLKLKNFGKFNSKTIDLSPGINLIYGENESGKTTLYHFIKGMLFGIERQRGKAAKYDLYSLCEPWNNSLFYEGELKFNAGGRNFRIERGFHKSQKIEKFINEDDAEELSIAQGDLVHILDGLNESVFKNTMAISQLKSDMDEGLANELKNYTSGYTLSGDGGVNVTNALANLLKVKKEYESRLRELQSKKQIKNSNVEKEKEYIQTDLMKKRNQLEEYISLHKSKKKLLSNQKEINMKHNKKMYVILNVIGIMVVLAGMIMIKPIEFKIGLLLVGIILLLFYNKIYQKILEVSNDRLFDQDGEWNRLLGAIEELREDIHDKEIMLSNINEKLQEVNDDHSEEIVFRIEIESLEMAYEAIQKSSMQLQKEISDDINRKASQILAYLTSDKYNDIRIDSNISTKLNTMDKIIYPEQVSKGTVDEINFSVRMAFLESFFGEETMPVFLDDAFAMYDNKRLARALQYLADNNRQVILLTCHKREKQLLEHLQIAYHFIQLI
ncbi:MAG: ATP-binding protein [Lachnotalea sp.]